MGFFNNVLDSVLSVSEHLFKRLTMLSVTVFNKHSNRMQHSSN